MQKSDSLEAKIAAASSAVGQELQAFATHSNQSSRVVASYALENVLLHQAAAQQINGVASTLVNTGQHLLATSRQLEPQLEQLAAMARVAKQLRQQAESLKHLGSTMQQLQQLKQQQQGQQPAHQDRQHQSQKQLQPQQHDVDKQQQPEVEPTATEAETAV